MKQSIYVVLGIGIIAVVLRLYGITSPIADWHSWRQADTAAVARNFIRFGMDPLHPRYDDLSNIQSGTDNPMGYRMVEFPLYQMVAVGLRTLRPQLPIEIWLRLVTIIASSCTAMLLCILVTRYHSRLAGFWTGIAYACLPFSVYYGRSILPDPFMVFWAVLAIYAIVRWSETKNDALFWLGIGSVSAACSLLVKPVGIFLFGPIAYLFLRHKKDAWWFFSLSAFASLACFPLYLWRQWILGYPEGIPAYTWLFNKDNIRFKGAWFHWIFSERIGQLILGTWGVIPLGIGILERIDKKESWIWVSWLVGVLAYVTILAAGNVQHDYYQILLLPAICVYFGKGMAYILTSQSFGIWKRYIVSGALLVFIGMFSWYTVRTFYWINKPEIVEAGRAADAMIPKDAKVIASYNGDTTFLYQIARQGWPLGFEIDKKIAQGATHYVTISPSVLDGETEDLASRYTVLVRNERYAIIDLTKPK